MNDYPRCLKCKKVLEDCGCDGFQGVTREPRASVDQLQHLLITELRKRGDPISLEAAAEIARLNAALEAMAPAALASSPRHDDRPDESDVRL